jgi:hypothetical protein
MSGLDDQRMEQNLACKGRDGRLIIFSPIPFVCARLTRFTKFLGS